MMQSREKTCLCSRSDENGLLSCTKPAGASENERMCNEREVDDEGR